MDPVTMMILGSAISKGVGAVGSAISSNSQSKRSAAEAQKDRDAAAKRALQDTALTESGMDPFRHSISQINAAADFDKIQNTTQKTVNIPGLNPKFMPTLGGGYQASQQMRDAAGTARENTLAGRGQAPSQTFAANYGETGVGDLLGGASSWAPNRLPPPVTIGGPNATAAPPSTKIGAPTAAAPEDVNLIAKLVAAGILPPDFMAKIGGSGGASMLPGGPNNRNTGVNGKQPVGQPFALSF